MLCFEIHIWQFLKLRKFVIVLFGYMSTFYVKGKPGKNEIVLLLTHCV